MQSACLPEPASFPADHQLNNISSAVRPRHTSHVKSTQVRIFFNRSCGPARRQRRVIRRARNLCRKDRWSSRESEKRRPPTTTPLRRVANVGPADTQIDRCAAHVWRARSHDLTVLTRNEFLPVRVWAGKIIPPAHTPLFIYPDPKASKHVCIIRARRDPGLQHARLLLSLGLHGMYNQRHCCRSARAACLLPF